MPLIQTTSVRKPHVPQPIPTMYLHACSKAWDIPIEWLQSESRHSEYTRARRAFTILCKACCLCSFPDIARSMNRKSHTAQLGQFHKGLDVFRQDGRMREMIAKGYAAIQAERLPMHFGDEEAREAVTEAVNEYFDAIGVTREVRVVQ